MKHLFLFTCLIAMPLSGAVAAEGAKTLASTLEVYVFPTQGQAADQQSKVEAECYSWAASNTGNDPFELQKQSEQQQQAQQQGAAQQQATQEQVGNFKKAFGVCLEAKNYMVKY